MARLLISDDNEHHTHRDVLQELFRSAQAPRCTTVRRPRENRSLGPAIFVVTGHPELPCELGCPVPEMLRHCQRTCSHMPPGLGPSLLDAASRSACAAAIRLAASCRACLTVVSRSVSVTAGGLGLLGAGPGWRRAGLLSARRQHRPWPRNRLSGVARCSAATAHASAARRAGRRRLVPASSSTSAAVGSVTVAAAVGCRTRCLQSVGQR